MPLLAATLLVVLTETGQTREGLPVLAIHPQGRTVVAQLDRGVSADLLRVYRMLQVPGNREKGTAIEPAYLLLSTRQGGFARYGFWLGREKKAGVPYVDCHRDWKLTGELGAIDQIFPHELSHAILHVRGARPPSAARSNQVHAVGVRTDRFTAMNEGLAEHFQIMAVDHPDAVRATRALSGARRAIDRTEEHLAAYRRELESRFAPASRMRIGFPLWYSQDERALRYFAVKENRFSRETAVPAALIERDLHAAYLIENIVPGTRGAAVKSVPRLLASEGAVSAFFHAWATSGELQTRLADAPFYERFGVRGEELTPLQNLYLKLFAAAGKETTDVPSLVHSYGRLFPEERPIVERAFESVSGGRRLESPPELWLASERLMTGTTVFDQFRGIPRVHTFDLNAASRVDLASVEGLSPRLAEVIAAGGPYRSLDELRAVDGMTPGLLGRMKGMAAAMRKLDGEGEETLSMTPILLGFAWRAGGALSIAAIAASLLHRLRRRITGVRPAIVTSILAGLGAALVGLIASWVSGNAAVAVAAVGLLYGVPAAAWVQLRRRSVRAALATLALWALMAVPAVLVTARF